MCTAGHHQKEKQSGKLYSFHCHWCKAYGRTLPACQISMPNIGCIPPSAMSSWSLQWPWSYIRAIPWSRQWKLVNMTLMLTKLYFHSKHCLVCLPFVNAQEVSVLHIVSLVHSFTHSWLQSRILRNLSPQSLSLSQHWIIRGQLRLEL